MKQTAHELVTLASNDSIIISLVFEMELVTNFFDITHFAHSRPGEEDRRAGFITMLLSEEGIYVSS